MQRLMILILMSGALIATGLSGCTQHRIKVEPIHMTLDVQLKVDRELDRYFGYEDEMDQPVNKTQPAAIQPKQGESQ